MTAPSRGLPQSVACVWGKATPLAWLLCLALEHPLLGSGCVTGLGGMGWCSCPSGRVCLLGSCGGDEGSCPRSSEPRDEESSRAESIPAVPLPCSLSLLQDQELELVWSQLQGCILLEAFRNCQRGKADFVCSCSSPRSVNLHYCIAVSKAENEKSEEWIPVTFVKNAMGRSNLLSLVNTAGFG